jgi:hypothetical protein
MSSEEAVRQLRFMRPGSIETQQQQRFVTTYCKELWRRFQRGEATQPQQHPEDADSGAQGEEGDVADHMLDGYPRTPHLPFSPQVASDDVFMDVGERLLHHCWGCLVQLLFTFASCLVMPSYMGGILLGSHSDAGLCVLGCLKPVGGVMPAGGQAKV